MASDPTPAAVLDGDGREGAAPVRDRRPAGTRWMRAAVVAVLALGVAARLVTFSHLWLDEAQSVNIARLPLGDMFDALRHDGAPPVYYLLLHGWMGVFGTSDFTVRLLSGIFAVGVLPLTWLVARRLGASSVEGGASDAGRRLAWVALILMASSPFAMRQATEARMYSLLMVLSLAGFLAFAAVVERRSTGAAVALAVVTGVLLLTHYWSFFLLAVLAVMLGARAVRGPRREGSRRALLAMGAGCLLFVPWLPSFLYQLGHTGTPWGKPGTLRTFLDAPIHLAGGYSDAGLALGLLFYALVGLGLTARAVDGRHLDIDLRTRQPGRALAVVAFGTIALALVVGQVTRAAFAVRYASVVFPLVTLLVALGVHVFAAPRWRNGILAVAVVLGFWAAVPSVFGERTAAPKVGRALESRASPGDVVAYCPDQLGPSFSRQVPEGIDQVTFPTGGPPELVDWVDYAARNRSARPAAFAEWLVDRAGPDHDVWVVWAPGFRTFSAKCQALVSELEDLRPRISRVVNLSSNYFERAGLVRYRPG